MSDEADNAQVQIDRHLERALSVRRAVPTRCECGDACAVLPNGARARFCDECLAVFQAGRA